MAQPSYTLTRSSATFTRPANATPYAVGQVFSDGSVIRIATPDRPYYIRRLHTSQSGMPASINLRYNVFSQDPTPFVNLTNGVALVLPPAVFPFYEGFLDSGMTNLFGLTTGIVGVSQIQGYGLNNTGGEFFLIATANAAGTPGASAITQVFVTMESAN